VRGTASRLTAVDGLLLEELRGYDGWTPELDALAVRAEGIGRLQEAFDAAYVRFFAAMGGSSLSSRTGVMVFDGSGKTLNQPAFLRLLRRELLNVLGEWRDEESC